MIIKTDKLGYVLEQRSGDEPFDDFVVIENEREVDFFKMNCYYLEEKDGKYFAVLDEKKYQERLEEEKKWEEDRQKQEEEETQARILQSAFLFSPMMMRAALPNVADEDIETITKHIPLWVAGEQYGVNMVVKHKEKNYRIVPTGGVTAQAHQPPDGVGMLAVYRPLSPNVDEVDGSKEKPYEFVYGMDVEKDKHYSYQGKTYVALQDAPNCIWYPGQAGVYIFKAV
ncbi:MAG: hypothetical protein GX786_10330 [Clostridiales bacterium]|nr:hypothetical protein [Clostridiales bacterium]